MLARGFFNQSLPPRILGKRSFSVPMSQSISLPQRSSGAGSKPELKSFEAQSVSRILSYVSNTSNSATVGLFFKAGSSTETIHNSGVSHYMTRYAYANGVNRTALSKVRMMESLTDKFEVLLGREYIGYVGQVNMDEISSMVALLREYPQPRLNYEWEVEEIKKFVKFDIDNLNNYDRLYNRLHHTAYRGSGLGNSLLCPSFNIDNAEMLNYLREYSDSVFNSKNAVVVAAGAVDTEELNTSVRNDLFFLSEKKNTRPVMSSPYVGGEYVESYNCEDGNTQVLIGYESTGLTSPNATQNNALALLLTQLLGTRSKNSKYLGNGRGLLADKNSHAFYFPYSSSSLVGVHGVVGSDQSLASFVEAIAKCFKSVTNVSEPDLNRAKAMAITSLYIDSESDFSNAVRLGVAATGNGPIYTPGEIANQLNNISANDLSNFVKHITNKSTPTVVAIGNVGTLPSLSNIQNTLKV